MINQLVANIKKTGAPIVVGLDPMLNYIPEQVQQKDGMILKLQAVTNIELKAVYREERQNCSNMLLKG